jgi:psp operon transcriptional activator
VDVRIVAATNESLPDQVDKGKFRADLLDRLSFEVVTLPPLRARTGDIPLLTDHFGRRMGVELEWPNWPGFSQRAVAELEAYNWPGNVRELRNVVERAVYRWEDPERPIDALQFDPFHSPWAPSGSSTKASYVPQVDDAAPSSVAAEAATAAVPSATTNDFRAAVTDYEKALLQNALAANRFNQRATATALNLSYDQLRHALKRHKLLETDAA